MTFPTIRMQRYRQTPHFRNILAETSLTKSNLIFPIFIHEGLSEKKAINLMPGFYQHSLKTLHKEVERICQIGIGSVILFGIPNHKDEMGSSSFEPKGIIQSAIRLIKESFPQIVVIADCCLCEYTSHGHCGLLNNHRIDNDKTLKILEKTALSYAESGADIIAPSGMMDGMIQAIRSVLDTHHFEMVSVMSYAVKYASQFYGPFREAGGSIHNFKGDRKAHQLPPTQKNEALREALLDVEEGADFLIVKPALSYLDIIKTIKEETLLPLVAYNTSGEYAMIKAAFSQGMLADEREAFRETLISMKRAGADLIISYYADEIAKVIP
ncbi:porphobilinogen synthase [Criblamydia sequanensis]|uniref:Delta-aminolevulinic acid dehydratase n=1 Tax=Candidatus Criblamydia sequanensis CRIB-18 TaxID=1437425 RepID=A0A090CZK5_9BACT|nr:porphobilinogen synthase [Criblamydia sequanensis]CDR32865.1 Delta-aminolevulinic acid dehydratase [Criblamydia sequanensis CRIB-18]